jgi:hypothetical protein
VEQELIPVPRAYGAARHGAVVASRSPRAQRLRGRGVASWGRQVEGEEGGRGRTGWHGRARMQRKGRSGVVAGARRRMRTARPGRRRGRPWGVLQCGRGRSCEGRCGTGRRRQAGHGGATVVAQVRGQAVASRAVVAS